MGLPETLGAILGGPGRLRFIIQPLVAILLGIRDGRQDVAAGRPPYVIAVVTLALYAIYALSYPVRSGLSTELMPMLDELLRHSP